jgi:gamma-glutamyltranspeptidase
MTLAIALSQALRLAFADARAYIADPEAVRVPVGELLSPVSTLGFVM